MVEKYNDYPWDEIVSAMRAQAAKGREVYQKWTCEHCGSRQGMPVPNAIYETGRCEECDKVTNIKANGCNYMLIASGAAAVSFLDEMAIKEKKSGN